MFKRWKKKRPRPCKPHASHDWEVVWPHALPNVNLSWCRRCEVLSLQPEA